MPLTDKELDLFIKRQIQKELDHVETPAVDEQWQKFQAKYSKPEMKLSARRHKVTFVAAILLIFTSAAVIGPSQVTAFGNRMFKTLNLLIAKTTGNKTSAEHNSVEKPDAKEQELTLQEAQKQVGFKIVQPSYLPEGTIIEQVTLNKLDTDIYTVAILYQMNGQNFTLTQRNTIGDKSDGLNANDSSKRSLDTFKIISYKINPDNGAAIIEWQKGKLILELKGTLPEDQLAKVVNSVN